MIIKWLMWKCKYGRENRREELGSGDEGRNRCYERDWVSREKGLNGGGWAGGKGRKGC